MRKAASKNTIFEITDHTNSTPYEELIYSIEQVIDGWGISRGRKNSDLPEEFTRVHHVLYKTQSFKFTHYCTKKISGSKPLQQAHFPSKTHCLNRWYGFSEFLILSPESTDDAIYFLDSSKLLMSSLATALTRTQCALPIFIQLGSPSKRFYCGVWLHSNTQTTLDMILLKTVPPQCSSLKEIICFYKRSIPCAISPFPQTFVSVRYTFCLHNFVGSVSPDSHLYPQLDASPWSLPFGTLNDPIQDLLLATTWVGVSEHFVLEELDPLKAPHWSLRYTPLAGAFCALYSVLEQVLAQWGNSTRPGNSPIVREEANVDSYLHFIFKSGGEEVGDLPTRVKSCPRGGCLTERIAVALCLLLNKIRSPIAFAELWSCVVERLRGYYERGQLLDGIGTEPNHGYSLLHQKIEMINACIQHKTQRESVQSSVRVEETHPELKLLLTDEPVKVPLTQRHLPLTEDMQEEQLETLARLGTDAEGSKRRAQYHSISLSSDMQAFKAANPDCRLEDFIRWYSPRDWIPVPITKTKPEEKKRSEGEGEEGSEEVTAGSDSEEKAEEEKKSDVEESSPADSRPDAEIESDLMEDTTETEMPLGAEEEAGEEERDEDMSSGAVQEEKTDTPEEDHAPLDATEETTPSKNSPSPPPDQEEDPVEEPASKDKLASAEDEGESKGVDSVKNGAPGVAGDSEGAPGVTGDSGGFLPTGGWEEDPALDLTDVVLEDQEATPVGFDEKGEERLRETSSTSPQEFKSYESKSTEADEFQSTTADNSKSPDSEDFKSSEEEFMDAEDSFVSSLEFSTFKSSLSSTSPPPAPTPSPNPVLLWEPLDPEIYGGHLSARMERESLWKELWHEAKPLPIWQQNRLFNDTQELERLLQSFSRLSVGGIVRMISPVLLHAALDRLLLCPDSGADFVREQVAGVRRSLEALDASRCAHYETFTEIAEEIMGCELRLSRFNSLRQKLSSVGGGSGGSQPQTKSSSRGGVSELERRAKRRIVRGNRLSVREDEEEKEGVTSEADLEERLVELLGAEVDVDVRGPWAATLQRLFHCQQASGGRGAGAAIFPEPLGREYILQTGTRHPSHSSSECPQRMFITVSGSEFRMAFASTTDKTFL